MTRASVRPLRHLDHTGYSISIREIRPEPYRRELLTTLAWLVGGVILSIVLSAACWLVAG